MNLCMKWIKYISFLVLFSGFNSGDGLQKKQIVSDDFTIDFFVNPNYQLKKAKTTVSYTWYKSGALFTTQGEVGGEILNGVYTKRYLSGQLAEKGIYCKGVKHGVWKTWHANGKLQGITSWKKGVKKGRYAIFDQKGMPQLRGNYKHNKKTGTWEGYTSKDTTFTYYKKGVINVKKTAREKEKLEKLKESKQPTQLKFKDRFNNFFKQLFQSKKKKKTDLKKGKKHKKNKKSTKKKSNKDKKSQ